uniref:DUF1618 domain-containing protein n=1 Tax=Oryza meridionalis TaxID=40149 RepID=A0A0E0D3I7_9ORYZ
MAWRSIKSGTTHNRHWGVIGSVNVEANDERAQSWFGRAGSSVELLANLLGTPLAGRLPGFDGQIRYLQIINWQRWLGEAPAVLVRFAPSGCGGCGDAGKDGEAEVTEGGEAADAVGERARPEVKARGRRADPINESDSIVKGVKVDLFLPQSISGSLPIHGDVRRRRRLLPQLGDAGAIRLPQDDDRSFPDDTRATVLRASGSGSHGTPFTIAFRIADPPAISRLYVRWPQGPDPEEMDYFIFTASGSGSGDDGDHPVPSPLLKALPPCTYHDEGDGNDLSMRYPLEFRSVGILCRGDEFAVAELQVLRTASGRVKARLCVLRSAISSSKYDEAEDGDHGGGGRRPWEIMELPIVHGGGDEERCDDIFYWTTDAVIAFQDHLCWVDYDRGMLLCDVLRTSPRIAFIRFPPDSSIIPTGRRSRRNFSQVYRGVSVTTDAGAGGAALKFADVSRHDGKLLGSLEQGRGGYTITCHTLRSTLGAAAIDDEWSWSKDIAIESDEILRSFEGPELDPREVLLFPTVSMDTPNVMHFLTCDYERVIRKMSVVTIDVASKTVLSVAPYVNGEEDLSGEDADMVRAKSGYPQSFLPSEFSKYFNSI